MASQVRASINCEEWILPVPAGSKTLKATKRVSYDPEKETTFNHDILGVGAVKLLGEHVEEGCEVKSAGSFVHHLFDISVFDVSDAERHVAKITDLVLFI